MGREIKQRNFALIEAILSVVGAGALGLSGWYDWGDYNEIAVVLLVVGVILVGANPVIAGYLKVQSEATAARMDERGEALACLVDLTHAIFDTDQMPKSASLRVSLLEADDQWDPAVLNQIARCENSGRREPGTHGMTAHQGVAGETYRRNESLLVNVDLGQFQAAMLKMGFSPDEAKAFDERAQYLCTPITDSVGRVIAVLSLDSKEPGVFDENVDIKRAERIAPFFSQFLTADK
jgi:hypothetical protein